MPKLKSDPITAADLEDFIASESDFGFEMQVLARLRQNGFFCEHSGTYLDPVTKKIRQFDIRAHISRGDDYKVALAVECKNLRPDYPLLLSAVPRRPHEAFHDVMVRELNSIYWPSLETRTGSRAAYKSGELVAKARRQVGRDNDKLVSSDEAFEKFNQAINSCSDLVQALAAQQHPPLRRVIVPVLVVPDGLLWQVDYNDEGTVTT